MPGQRLMPDCGVLCQAGAITGFLAAFTEGPIDFYKSQAQYQIIRSKSDPKYKRALPRIPACLQISVLSWPVSCTASSLLSDGQWSHLYP